MRVDVPESVSACHKFLTGAVKPLERLQQPQGSTHRRGSVPAAPCTLQTQWGLVLAPTLGALLPPPHLSCFLGFPAPPPGSPQPAAGWVWQLP